MSLTLAGISHRYGAIQAVRGASLEVRPGEIVCLFGPSGCGKTTLLRVAAGLEPLQEGTVSLGGETLAVRGRETPPEKRPIGFVFQDYALFPHLSVEKNVAFGIAEKTGLSARIAEQLAAFNIEELAQRYPHELSGGQQQRVALARAMARAPKALLLDEPFASIDVALRRRLRAELRRVLKEQQAAVLLVTHDPEEALALGDRLALMRAGEIIETATPEDLYWKPSTPEGAGLFRGSQTLPGNVRGGVFHSALGEAPAPDIGDGPGRAILRAGALRAEADPAGAFEVKDFRFHGPNWRVELAGPEALRLSVMMAAPLERGARAAVRADWSKAFIFAG